MDVQLPQVPTFLETNENQRLKKNKPILEALIQESSHRIETPEKPAALSGPHITSIGRLQRTLDWESLLRSKSSTQDLVMIQQQLGQLNDMLAMYAPDTKWTTVWYGAPVLSLSLLANVYHFLKTLVTSSQWHQPERAEIICHRWNNLPAIKISWKKVDVPPLFVEESEEVEFLINQQSGQEIIQIFETHFNSMTGKEL